MGYRSSTARFWAGIKGKNLTKEALILALYVELYHSAHFTGLYHLAVVDIQLNTGLTEGEIRGAMEELEREGIAIFDRQRTIVFVPGMMLRQLGAEKKINAKQQKGVVRHLEGFSPESPPVLAFNQFYGLNIPDTSSQYPHAIPVSDSPTAYNLNLNLRPEDEKRDLNSAPNSAPAPAPLKGAEPVANSNGNGKPQDYPLTTDQAVSKASARMECGEWSQDEALHFVIEKSGTPEDLALQLLGITETPETENARDLVEKYVRTGKENPQ